MSEPTISVTITNQRLQKAKGKETLNAFFSSLPDGKLPPWLLAHSSAILTRITTYGVCL